MPRQAKVLSSIEVNRLKHLGFHAVGGVPGLLLRVKPSGSRQWILRAVSLGKRRDFGLGGFPAVGESILPSSDVNDKRRSRQRQRR